MTVCNDVTAITRTSPFRHRTTDPNSTTFYLNTGLARVVLIISLSNLNNRHFAPVVRVHFALASHRIRALLIGVSMFSCVSRWVVVAVPFAFVVFAASADSAGPPPGERWSDHAWRGTSSSKTVPRPSRTASPVYPTRSTIVVRPLPYEFTDPKVATVANVVAHLPPGADLWIGKEKMVSEASKPSYDLVTPAIEAGGTYSCRATVVWEEDGKWVTQTHSFSVRAGDFHCIEVVPVDPASAGRDVAAGLAKLPEADKKAAEAQKFCAIQDSIRLGSMGAPVKVNVEGKDVYLCCEGCRTNALKDPTKTLKTAEANKAKPVKAESGK